MNIYQHLKWLNAFAEINYIAMQTIIKKFIKEHFEINDNMIDKGLLKYIESKDMLKRKKLTYLLEDLKTFYARFFTNGDVKRAEKHLSQFNSNMRRQDAI